MTSNNERVVVNSLGVKIYPPKSKVGKQKYFRIVYNGKDYKENTTAKSYEEAEAVAKRISMNVLRGGKQAYKLPVSEMIDAYLNPEIRSKVSKAWGPKHTAALQSLFNFHIRPAKGQITCAKLTASDLHLIVANAQTKSVADRLTQSIRAFIQWGVKECWIIQDPDIYLGSFPVY